MTCHGWERRLSKTCQTVEIRVNGCYRDVTPAVTRKSNRASSQIQARHGLWCAFLSTDKCHNSICPISSLTGQLTMNRLALGFGLSLLLFFNRSITAQDNKSSRETLNKPCLRGSKSAGANVSDPFSLFRPLRRFACDREPSLSG